VFCTFGSAAKCHAVNDGSKIRPARPQKCPKTLKLKRKNDEQCVEAASLTYVWRYGIFSAMKRTTIWLTDSQVKALAKISKKTGMKQAELIRRFIDRGIEKSR